jgi:hypothetical protein
VISGDGGLSSGNVGGGASVVAGAGRVEAGAALSAKDSSESLRKTALSGVRASVGRPLGAGCGGFSVTSEWTRSSIERSRRRRASLDYLAS